MNLLLLSDGFETTAFTSPDGMVGHNELFLKLCPVHHFMLLFFTLMLQMNGDDRSLSSSVASSQGMYWIVV